MGDELNGRRVHTWLGVDRQQDIADLAKAIAKAIPELYCRDGGVIVQFNPTTGSLAGVNLAQLRALIDQHICGVRLVQRNGAYAREYFSYGFAGKLRRALPTAANPCPKEDESLPDNLALDEIYRSKLAPLLPKVV